MKDQPHLQTFTNLSQIVCDYYKVELAQLRSNKKIKRAMQVVYPTWALILLLYEVKINRFDIGELIQKKPDSVATIASKAKRRAKEDHYFKEDMELLHEYVKDPSKLIPRLKGKSFSEEWDSEPQATTLVRAPQPWPYSNRNMHNIHDEYAKIAV